MSFVANREANKIPAKEGLVVIILYLALSTILEQWQLIQRYNGTYIPHLFIYLRVVFLGAVVWLCQRRWRIPLGAAFGTLNFPPRNSWALCGILLVATMAVRIIGDVFLFPDAPFPPSFKNVLDACLIAPVNEELWFRGFVLSCLLSVFKKDRYPLLLSALIFSYVHSRLLTIHIFMLIPGLLFAFAFARMRSISVCMLLHSVWNALAFLDPVV